MAADFVDRLSPSCLEEFEDEVLDPRIQVELERLNRASEEINKLELELDDARSGFRQALSEATQRLNGLAKKLGAAVEKARPYYDCRMKAKEAHVETQKAALRFERACSMHEAAKEMVQLAEQGYMKREEPSDPAWQEMLNHATMKVNEAEKERLESEQEHQKTTSGFLDIDDRVQRLQKEIKRAIAKSNLSTRRSFLQLGDIVNRFHLETLPYYETKAKFNHTMEDHKRNVGMLEEDVNSAKTMYSEALRNLESISDEIHRQRHEKRKQDELGVRGAGVGAEDPSPPPSREKGAGTIDGRSSSPQTSVCDHTSHTNFSTSAVDGNVFMPLSVIYSSPETARKQSYRTAIDLGQEKNERTSWRPAASVGSEAEEFPVPSLEEEYMFLPNTHSPRSQSVKIERQVSADRQSGIAHTDDVFTPSPEKSPPREVIQGNKIPSREVTSVAMSETKNPGTCSGESSPVSGSPSGVRKVSKLQGIILRIDPKMDPLSRFEASSHQGFQSKGVPSYSEVPQNRPVSYSDKTLSDRSTALPESLKNQSASQPDGHPRVGQAAAGNLTALKFPDTNRQSFEGASRRVPEQEGTSDVTTCRTRGLQVPQSSQDLDDISDTESITSVGPMLDDDQVELLTLNFSEQAVVDVPQKQFTRNDWSRMTLPPRLSHLEHYIVKTAEWRQQPETVSECVEEVSTEQEVILEEVEVSSGKDAPEVESDLEKRASPTLIVEV